MANDTLPIAALIGSRICHDLISPIGAISNGLELAAMAPDATTGPEMDLIQQSCDNATARIRFFRIAFGHAGSQHAVSAAEARGALVDYFQDSRVEPQWAVDEDMTRGDVQRAYLAVMCVETMLPMGGQIVVRAAPGALSIVGHGQTKAELVPLWTHLTRKPGEDLPNLTAAQVQFALLGQICADNEPPPGVNVKDNQVMVSMARCE